MKITDLAQAAAEKSGVDSQVTRKVLDAAFGILGAELAKGEKLQLQGLGTFIQRPAKEPSKKARTRFKPWAAKAEKSGETKAKRVAKRKARKQAKEGKTS